jgi:hypothetical protein
MALLPGPPLWSSRHSSWLQIQRSEFDSRRYEMFWELVGLERGPLSLVSTIEKLLGRKNSCSGLEIPEYGRGDPLRWPHGTLYPQKLILTSLTSGGRSVGIACSRTQATEFLKIFLFCFRPVVCVSTQQRMLYSNDITYRRTARQESSDVTKHTHLYIVYNGTDDMSPQQGT